jgi:hypothetical protein
LRQSQRKRKRKKERKREREKKKEKELTRCDSNLEATVRSGIMHLDIIILVEIVLHGIQKDIVVLLINTRITHNKNPSINQNLSDLVK